MKLVLNSNNDVKNVHVSESFLIDDWSDIQFGSNVTVNVNTYVTGDHTVLNGPGTNYWAPSNPDTLNGTFAKGIWTENDYCYIEYPIYNASGTVTEYRRGYVPDANVSESFGANDFNSTTAYIEDGSVYSMPSTSSQNLGTFVDVVAVTILDEENGLYYIEYLYNGTGPSKRGYVEKNRIFQAATGIELTDDAVTLYLGETYPLSVVFTPENPKNKEVIWESSDDSIATVSNSGKVSAVKTGTVTITVTAKIGGASDSCTINITPSILDTFANTEVDLEKVFADLDSFLNDYLDSISPPRYCGNVEITAQNKDSTNCQGENIYLFLYDWYSEHIWPYEMDLPEWSASAHNPATAERTKLSALNKWSQKVYGETTWEGIINGFDNIVDCLYYELTDLGTSLTAAVKQIVGGNYSDEVTVIGTIGQITLSFLGVDLVADVRDVIYDGTHWKWTWSHAGQTGLDLIGLVPLIGSLKNLDELSALIKNADSLSDLTKHADELVLIEKKIEDYVSLAKQTGKFDEIAHDTEFWAKIASKRDASKIVVLGRYEKVDGIEQVTSYNKVAEKLGYSCFSMPDNIYNALYTVLKEEG